MRLLKLSEENGHKRILIDDREYSYKDEVRGVREKFWLTREGSKIYFEPMSIKQILFKYNRNSASFEDYGEIIASRLAKQIGLPCVDYYLAGIEGGEDGEIRRGVICGSYKRNDAETEFSVESLQKVMSTPEVDESTGDMKNVNTVYGICSALEHLKTFGVTDEDINKVKIDILKQVIFDFVLAQTDRHWRNTTILMYRENDDKASIRKAPCYDNGCIAFLKTRLGSIEGKCQRLGKLGKDSPNMVDIMNKYMPMLGIHTQTVDLIPCKTCDAVKMQTKKDLEVKEAFINELAREILVTPELAIFYHDLKKRINMEAVFNRIEKEGDEVPWQVKKLVTDIVGYQIDVLEGAINVNLQKIKEEMGDL